MAIERVRHMGARYVRARRQRSAELIGFLEERLSGLPDVQTNGAADYADYVVYRAEERLRTTVPRYAQIAASRSPHA